MYIFQALCFVLLLFSNPCQHKTILLVCEPVLVDEYLLTVAGLNCVVYSQSIHNLPTYFRVNYFMAAICKSHCEALQRIVQLLLYRINFAILWRVGLYTILVALSYFSTSSVVLVN